MYYLYAALGIGMMLSGEGKAQIFPYAVKGQRSSKPYIIGKSRKLDFRAFDPISANSVPLASVWY